MPPLLFPWHFFFFFLPPIVSFRSFYQLQKKNVGRCQVRIKFYSTRICVFYGGSGTQMWGTKFLANWFRRHLSLKREERREVRIRRFRKVASMNLPSLADRRAFSPLLKRRVMNVQVIDSGIGNTSSTLMHILHRIQQITQVRRIHHSQLIIAKISVTHTIKWWTGRELGVRLVWMPFQFVMFRVLCISAGRAKWYLQLYRLRDHPLWVCFIPNFIN